MTRVLYSSRRYYFLQEGGNTMAFKITDECIACGLCQMACPNDTIRITSESVLNEETGKKKKVLVKYEYDLGACMFCQLCVNACPHGAIEFTTEFENAVFDRATLVQTLNKK